MFNCQGLKHGRRMSHGVPRRHGLVPAAFAACALLLAPAAAKAAVLQSGDILVTRLVEVGENRWQGEVVKVDPATGAQTVISSPTPGSGRLADVAVRPDGLVYLVESMPEADSGTDYGAVYRLDPATGARTFVFSPSTVGFRSPDFYTKGVFDAAGRLVVLARSDPGNTTGGYGGGLIRYDPATGALSRVDTRGTLRHPYGLALDAGGGLITSNFEDVNVQPNLPNALVRVDPVTGAVQELATRRNSQELIGNGIAVAPDGGILLGDGNRIARFDPDTGQVSTVSSDGLLRLVWDVALDGSGGLLVADSYNGLLRVDLATGAQVPLAGNLTAATGIAVVSVPEPSGLTLLGLSGMALCVRRRRRYAG